MEDFHLKWEEYKPIREHIREIYSVITSTVEELTQTLDTSSNFDIELIEDKNNIDIVLTKNDNKITLGDYLPKWYKFIFDNNYKSNSVNKTVSFIKEDVNKQFFLLQLLHEMGHAIDIDINKKIRRVVSEKSAAKAQGTIKRVYYACKHRNLFFLKNSEVLPNWYLEKFTKIKAISEKRAWKKGIMLAEDLQDKGFDILDEYTVWFMNMCLLTYEMGVINDRYLSGLPLRSQDINLFLENGGTELVKKFMK